jgi:hypothetical protein
MEGEFLVASNLGVTNDSKLVQVFWENSLEYSFNILIVCCKNMIESVWKS